MDRRHRKVNRRSRDKRKHKSEIDKKIKLLIEILMLLCNAVVAIATLITAIKT